MLRIVLLILLFAPHPTFADATDTQVLAETMINNFYERGGKSINLSSKTIRITPEVASYNFKEAGNKLILNLTRGRGSAISDQWTIFKDEKGVITKIEKASVDGKIKLATEHYYITQDGRFLSIVSSNGEKNDRKIGDLIYDATTCKKFERQLAQFDDQTIKACDQMEKLYRDLKDSQENELRNMRFEPKTTGKTHGDSIAVNLYRMCNLDRKLADAEWAVEVNRKYARARVLNESKKPKATTR